MNVIREVNRIASYILILAVLLCIAVWLAPQDVKENMTLSDFVIAVDIISSPIKKPMIYMIAIAVGLWLSRLVVNFGLMEFDTGIDFGVQGVIHIDRYYPPDSWQVVRIYLGSQQRHPGYWPRFVSVLLGATNMVYVSGEWWAMKRI